MQTIDKIPFVQVVKEHTSKIIYEPLGKTRSMLNIEQPRHDKKSTAGRRGRLTLLQISCDVPFPLRSFPTDC